MTCLPVDTSTSVMNMGGDGASLPPPTWPPKSMCLAIPDAVVANGSRLVSADPTAVLARNVVALSGPDDALLDYDLLARINHVYSHTVTHESKCADQKASGRCWIFAATNVLRQTVIEKFNLSGFEFSQSHLHFYDKLEKANYFLNAIIETAHEDLDSRVVQHLLSKPTEDGGQWDMIVNLVNKYGLMPKSVWPESYFSSATRSFNTFVSGKLRDYASGLRQRVANGEDPLAYKEECMTEFYQCLVRALGEPPQTFDWAFKTKSGEQRIIRDLSPQSFFKEHVAFDIEQRVCLVNDPRPEHPYGSLMTVKYLGNVAEGHPVRYVNLPIEDLKRYIIASLQRNEPVWFGCDVGKDFSRRAGVMDTQLMQYDLVYGTHCALDKAERLKYGQSCMTHAMVITGVDLDKDGAPQKW
ncbi:MAG: C1 family peptidase, partial [Chlamydiia bacterium]|nr:C1 family peptidase [Chlamydiia bacterium]